MSNLMERMNWMQIEEYLKTDDRIVLATGSVEQHGYNTVCTDTQCVWEIAKAACNKTGVLLAPSVNYCYAGWATAFPGTVSISATTTMALIKDILRSLVSQGFKNILVLNGHGHWEYAANLAIEELAEEYPELHAKFRSWYMLPKTYETIQAEGCSWGCHASFLESFPWINQPEGVEIPDQVKPAPNLQDYHTYGPKRHRELFPDGMTGGAYKKDDEFMRKYFQGAVEQVVEILEGSWEKTPVYAE